MAENYALQANFYLNASGYQRGVQQARDATLSFEESLNALAAQAESADVSLEDLRAIFPQLDQALKQGLSPSRVRAFTNLYKQAGMDSGQAFVRATQEQMESISYAQRGGGISGMVSNLSGGIQGLASGMYELQSIVYGTQELMRVVTAPAEKLLAIGEEAARRADTRRVFERVSGGAEAAEENIRALQAAYRNTITESEAMDQATAILAMGLADNADELNRVAKYVNMLGSRFGGNMQMFQLMVSNQSLRRVDSFGLGIQEVTNKIEKFEAAGMSAEDAFRAGVLEAMGEKFQDLGGDVGQTTDAFAQLRVASEELRNEWEDKLLPLAVNVARAATDLTKIFSGSWAENYTQDISSALGGAEGAEEFGQVIDNALEGATSFKGMLLGLPQDIGDWHEVILEQADTFDEYVAGVEAYNQAIDWLNKSRGRRNQLPGLEASQSEWQDIVNRREQAAQEVTAEETRTAGRAAAEAAVRASEKKVQEIANKNRQAADIREQAAQRAAQAEIRWARRAEDEVIATLRRREDRARKTAQQREDISRQYHQALIEAERQYQQALQAAARSHNRQRVSIERNYRRELEDIERDYNRNLDEAVVARDAVAIYRLRRRRREQIQDARRSRDEQMQQANEQYQEQLQRAREALQEQRRMARESRQQALDDLRRQLRRELQEQQIADRRRIEDQNRAKQREAEDRQRWLDYRLAQVYQTNAAEQTAMQQHYQVMAQMRSQYLAQVSQRAPTTPSLPDNRPTPYATGGYTGAGGLSLLHAGEFVLNRETTRTLEARMGPLSQEAVSRMGGGVRIQIGAPQFVGVAQQDRGWIRQELRAFEGRLTNEVARALEG
jgi:hypothetical protein